MCALVPIFVVLPGSGYGSDPETPTHRVSLTFPCTLFASTPLLVRPAGAGASQVEFSLLNQKALEDRTIDTCKQLGVVVLGHTPLAGGLGSGKYTATNPTGGKFVNSRGAGSRRSPSSRPGGGRYGPAPGAKYSFDELRRWLPIHNALTSVARSVSIREEMKVSPTQIALNWVVAKGVVPLPGVNTNADANEVVGCIGWRLRAQDIETLDKAVEESRNTKVERQTLGYTQY